MKPHPTTGEIRHRRQQRGWVHIPGKPYPQEIAFNLPDGVQLYPSGSYIIDPERSLNIDKWGSLNFGFSMTLKPLQK